MLMTPVVLMPSVTFEQHTLLTPHGPVGFSVITAPAPADPGSLTDRPRARSRHRHRPRVKADPAPAERSARS